MLNSIVESRKREENGIYRLNLSVSEKAYFSVYDSVNEDAGYEIIDQYLNYHQDDGRPEKVQVKYNKNSHIINISAELHYTDNKHTDPKYY
ncbi:hypothetical protein [Thermohalobacter berrensis]|uniref:Uncharacterized protein n=1 Tax=Thermohalobacter berrensis TaxID=99594 RepID=A0A419T1Y6_9FIRM|nr:hypothetical protein [Thermohalobacter berrensis]RKD31463.1 hypothetical protein BET03_12670 [Thermohalobacter berrensis]